MTGDNDRVVVGVDGSDASLGALAWALDWAEAAGAEVTAVSVWTYDPMLDEDSQRHSRTEAQEAHLRELKKQTAAVRAGSRMPVRFAAPDGDPADVLVELSEQARMLAVGSHGRGKWRDALVGSVSGACLRHAHCPVAVIPPRAWMAGGRVGRMLAGAAESAGPDSA
ncbi:universal stress protein [Amycolatopsis benzoatilytica]|uniref:universal stress protein n=1 Tax=Amycolatopsis benzoatilytica TaxID=346045 RepID=UPI0003749AF0|nr:universal stress protein [Amycolatopsis benzoatilytica]